MLAELRRRFRSLFPESRYRNKHITDGFLDVLHFELLLKGARAMEVSRAAQVYRMHSKGDDPLGAADPVSVYRRLQADLNRKWRRRPRGRRGPPRRRGVMRTTKAQR